MYKIHESMIITELGRRRSVLECGGLMRMGFRPQLTIKALDYQSCHSDNSFS
jgi:hypothetical protein